MREFMNIINEAAAPKASFALAPSFDPANYQITGSLKDAEKWQAMTYMGDGQIPQGKMAKVGYIWISKADNTIVPISRGDEHHQGGDMISRLRGKKAVQINPSNYVPIFWTGHTYVYSQDDVKALLLVLPKWLAYGGVDGVIEGANSKRGLALTMSQFVETGGFVDITPGKLAPLGAKLFAAWKAVQDAIVKGFNATTRTEQTKPFRVALEFASVLASMGLSLLALIKDFDDIKNLPKQIRALAKENDLQGLNELFFGFNSIKRAMHEKMRHIQPKDWDYANIKAFWGDVDLAVDMLSDL